MSSSRKFSIAVGMFVLGVLGGSFFRLEVFEIYLIAVLALSALFLFYKNGRVVFLSLGVLFFVFGFWRVQSVLFEKTSSSLVGTEIRESAFVAAPVQDRGKYQQINLQLEKDNVHAIANISVPQEISYGDRVDILCTLEKADFTQGTFDYAMYLAKNDVEYVCKKPKIFSIRKSGHTVDAYGMLLFLRSECEDMLSRFIPEPESTLAAGLLFGGGGGLPDDVKTAFSKTGMTHIIAVSGYNVSIVAEYLILLGLALGFWRKQALWFAIGGIFIFVGIVGFPASAVRAGVMGSIVIWALKHGRLAGSYNAILLAAAMMLAINPLLLRWDVGFQLSFMATVGVVLISEIWQQSRWYHWKLGGISEIIVLSIGAQLFVLPIILFNFKLFSVISVVANVLVLPMIPVSMLLVLLVVLLGFMFQPIAQIISWVAYILLAYEILVIKKLSNASFASYEIGHFGIIHFIAYYLILFFLILRIKNKHLLNAYEKS